MVEKGYNRCNQFALVWLFLMEVLQILQNVEGQTGTSTAFWPAWTRLTGALDGPCQSELI